jgi:uncharacterized protein with GYD domain
MPKYLFTASYTQEGVQGLLKDGGTARQTAVKKMVKGLGGKVESMYYAFGDDDVLIVAEVATIRLLTPEQIDAAAKKKVSYSPPGG